MQLSVTAGSATRFMVSDSSSILGLDEWLRTAPGRYLLAWEQQQLDQSLADCFGFHALQLGLPAFDALRANRMPHRWIAHEGPRIDAALLDPVQVPEPDPEFSTMPAHAPLSLHCDWHALPFPSASLDLVVLPHTLERARDAHDTLREVERVLVPEGRVAIVGFNPASLWGLRQRVGAAFTRSADSPLLLPREGEFIGYWRLRDWLRLLGLEVEIGRFGCWRLPLRTERGLQRMRWLERAGERWWPVFGAVYLIVAVKRVRGMRLVGLSRGAAARPKASAAVVTQHRPAAVPAVPLRRQRSAMPVPGDEA